MKISIVIPTYNRVKELDALLRSLNPFNVDEILIIDNSSTDNTEAMVSQHQLQNKSIRFFQVDERSIPKARNYGVHQAKGDAIIFVDSDMTIEGTDWLFSLVLPLRKRGLGISFGRVITSNRTFIERYTKASKGLGMPDLGDKPFEVTKNNFVTFPLGNVAFKKEVFNIVGEFDNDLKVGEDIDFCRRAIKHFKFAHVPDALTFHHHRSTICSLIKHGLNTGYFDIALREKYKKSEFDDRYAPKKLAILSLVPLYIIFGLLLFVNLITALILTVVGYSFLILLKYTSPIPTENKREIFLYPFIDIFYLGAYSLGWWARLVNSKNYSVKKWLKR